MNAISLISEEKVLELISIPSSTEILVNNCVRIGNDANSAGTLSSAILMGAENTRNRSEP